MDEGLGGKMLEMLQDSMKQQTEAERKNARLECQHKADQKEIARLTDLVEKQRAVIENLQEQVRSLGGMSVMIAGDNNGLIGESVSNVKATKKG